MLQNIPKVDKVLEWPEIKSCLERQPRPVVLAAIREVLDEIRTALRGGSSLVLEREVLAAQIVRGVERAASPGLRRVINGTGVILHTNLGRAPLAESLRQAMLDAAFGYCTLEFDLETGRRGSRAVHVERLLCELTGAEAAVVVNNNAAAVLLALSALAKGREVIVSRGELVEIGGSFRIPEVMEQGGAMLREVGTTNRTHPRDYRAAVTADTGLLLKVHTSNFAVTGFTAEVDTEELVAIGRDVALPVMVDAGSGTLVDVSAYGLSGEKTVRSYLDAGADVVTFSGDKLLGGPQAGLIVGRRAAIEPMKKHPLLRALRVDKVTLAALEGTLRLYRDEQQALAEIPTLRLMTVSAHELAVRARRAARRLGRAVADGGSVRVVSGFSQVGGGTFPLLQVPSSLIAITLPGVSAQRLEEQLRTGGPVPIIGRIANDLFLLDIRTIADRELPEISAALRAIKPVS